MVFIYIVSITMDGFSTVTQKGQVAIPKPIRDYFKLKASDKLYFEVKNNNIVAHPIFSIEQMRGIVKENKYVTKKEYKKIIRNAVIEKLRRKTHRGKRAAY